MHNPASSSGQPTAAYSKKICLLGDFAVGKTSLVRKFVYALFDDKYISTIGVKVSRKTVAVISHGGVAELTMMLWDLAGSENFDQIRASYLRGSAGAILVCDLTRPETLAHLRVYVQDLRRQIADPQLILAANKVDLKDEQRISEADITALAAELGTPLIFTSAKTGQGVEEIFRTLGSMLIK
ncbi:MAG: GTP-binding protein [Caldilineaceae bacterium]|nr:GTP-binding protein [Caldilineaceae bacterium]MBP8110177.1 GTP-binding protein [Caldilineaceae bacterium]MBP8122702.1 GTP-binding protein [Caldilineaceae bacterium]MBP9072172.1 GTP-binding protein [Caldilineaceae bacterium]